MDQKILEDTKKEARRLLDENRPADALPLIRQLAHWGDLQAQKELIDVYYHHGYGYPRNPQAAYEYARLAALNGDASAMTLLGKLLLNGEGCRKDPDTALYFLGKAAEMKDPQAIDAMAMVCLKGLAGPRDLKKARMLSDRAIGLIENLKPENEREKRAFQEIRDHSEMIDKYAARFPQND